jgi:hypothetical protein
MPNPDLDRLESPPDPDNPGWRSWNFPDPTRFNAVVMGHLLLRAEGDFAQHGCSSQRMGLWNADGAPVATGMQSIAIFD